MSNSNKVRYTSLPPPDVASYLFVPTASISSINIIVGASSRADLKSSLTSLGPSPAYDYIISEPTIFKNVEFVSCATALASNDLPVPGGPYKMHALGGTIPNSSYFSG